MGSTRPDRFEAFLRRLLAAGCIGLVFALGAFAASPSLHHQLHADAPSLDDGCAIVLFATGVSVPLALVAAPPAPQAWTDRMLVGSTEVLLDSPRYLLQPERGPPVG